jgi:uncharacterized membrane protein
MLDSASNEVKTYRYLRLGMVALLAGLACSVAIEWWNTGRRCFQTSISAYYYTPAQGIFVATLLAIGVCMVVIKGNTNSDDILLNIGGMLAPVVAFVPTPSKGNCYSVPVNVGERGPNVANNMAALFLVGVIALVLTVAIGRKALKDSRNVVGVALAVLLLAVAFYFFWKHRLFFLSHAHYAAANTMFVCIIAVVVWNAREYGKSGAGNSRHEWVNRYGIIAAAMIVTAGGMFAAKLAFTWDHAVLWIEGSLLLLFAVFWIFQTRELWNHVKRPDPPDAHPEQDQLKAR